MPEKLLAGHGNKYQPLRRAAHHILADIQTSPDGKDWSRIINERSDVKLADRGLFEKLSFNVFGTVLPMEYDRMIAAYPEEGEMSLAQMQEKAMLLRAQEGMKDALATNGVGHSFIHTLLPDLSRTDKRILVRAGLQQFERDSGGHKTDSFWPAETALDTETLEVLEEEGVRKVIGAPWQVRLDSGISADNQPTSIRLPNGRDIVVVPFSWGLQEAISWGDRSSAPQFVDRYIVPAFDWAAPNENSKRFNFIATDMETFGAHEGTEGLDEFLQVLFETLPDRGITATTLNDLDVSDAVSGRLVERSAWSCKDGDLRRWHGPCDCHGGAEARQRSEWKTPYYHAHHKLNGDITRELMREGITEDHLTEELAVNFAEYLKNPGDTTTNTTKSALSAKASALAATTSCATFFRDTGTSGYINPLFALQAIYHLRDAGFVAAAERVEGEYMKNMAAVRDPDRVDNYTGKNMVEDLLERKIGAQHNVFSIAAD